MRKSRKTKNKSPFFFTKKTTTTKKSSTVAADDAVASGGGGGGGAKFFGCYLLASLSPRHKGHTYIGFTVNPKRRIRQHNGEITSGASKTKRKRPWEMVLCIHGFPTNISALQFEWAWQHPRESVSVREIATSFKTIGGLANKIKLALTMLTLPSWQSMDLTVSIFSTNYMKHTVGCPTLPRQMKVHFSSLDDLPCYSNPNYLCVSDNDDNDDDDDDTHFHGSHHLNETLEFGFVETDPSTDIPSYTLQNTPEPELVLDLDHQPVDRSLDEQDQCVADVCDLRDEVHRVAGNVTSFGSYNFSNTIFPTLRKHVNSSTVNNLDECTSPTTLEEPFGSYNFSNKIFPTLRKHVNSSTENNLDECTSPTTLEEPFGSYNFSNNIFPTLKKHVNSSTENNSEEYTRPTIEEPFRQPPHFMRDQLSTADYVLIEESPREKHQAAGKNPSTSSTDIFGATSSTEIEPIEVIDLYTPSPNYGDIGFSKKRKFPSSYSNFIDLTNSPVFLEQ